MYIVIGGIFVHLILLLSIFDIYFKSPIINDVPPCATKSTPPAKRLVLFVADGLRAESLFFGKENTFESMSKASPYLSWICSTQGSWGISHTRVPTESRPGHVALAAGFYEDPSAVAKGWKENTVEFDSIFNQSTYSWAWGSPDIVPMFAKGSSGDHVFIDTYDSKNEDFSGKDSSELLDTWVFDKVELFFKHAKNTSLMEKLHSDKVVFFLHLLGLDTAGHTDKPNSKQYWLNVDVVDKGVKRMEHIIESFFGDKQTTFIFTSDHGMTDWGSHGAGSPSETETPFVIWGAGIRRNPKQKDINQADITPLMASIIGVPVPVNSVGVLPLHFLNMSNENKARAILSNACQMSSQFDEKRRRTEENTWKILYREFPYLNKALIQKYNADIEAAIKDDNYQLAIILCQDLIKISLAGLDYYQNYYQKLLLFCTTMSYIGWISVLFINILKQSTYEETLHKRGLLRYLAIEYTTYKRIHNSFALIMIITLFLLYSQNFPIMFYLHCMLPIVIWWCFAINCRYWSSNLLQMWRKLNNKTEFICWTALYIVGIETLVFCFFDRRILTVSLWGISLWPCLSKPNQTSSLLKTSWSATCLGLCVFPFLSVIGSYYNMYLIIAAGIIWIGFGVLCTYLPNLVGNDFKPIDQKHKILTTILNVQLILAIINIYEIEKSFNRKEGLPFLNQICSWILLITSFILPMLGKFYITNRLLNIKQALAIPVILLSVSYEPIFILVLFINLFLWLLLEHKLSHRNVIKLTNIQFVERKTDQRKLEFEEAMSVSEESVHLSDFRRAYFFLFYILLAFFGTGNMASLNSFDPTWVRNFLTVFSPFTMAALILFKTVTSFIAVSCTFRAITVAVKAPIRQLFLIVLMLGDIMGLQFLYFVKNQGSWLEIGTTISHFVIVQSIVVFLILFYYLAIALTEIGLLHKRKIY